MIENIGLFTSEVRVGYFSMEIALRSDVPTYSGGLGVLAGDTLRSAADLGLPMLGVTLVHRQGYFRQTLDPEGRQHEEPDRWDCSAHATLLQAKTAIMLDGRTVWIGAWLYVLEGHMGGQQPVILLDTDLPENAEEDRNLTHHLYGGDIQYRFKQEAILGIGGFRLVHALGFRIRRYHMNEGHSALLGLELLKRTAYPHASMHHDELPFDVAAARELCCFTTHTPVEAGHDRFSYDQVGRTLGSYMDLSFVKRLAGEHELNMTHLALNLSCHVNGVAKRHAETSRQMFPGYTVKAVTNGVHPYTWTCRSFAGVYNRHIPGWCHEPELLLRAECCIPDEEIAKAHHEAKAALVSRIKDETGRALDIELPILGFARRMTAYKRPNLLFADVDNLKRIAEKTPFQIVMAGKAHPHDDEGKKIIEEIHVLSRQLGGRVSVVFLPNYDMDKALAIISGVDVWLNTPTKPMEASGTSGMKAAFNGVPSLSILDGWWLEGCIEGITGWAIGTQDCTSDMADAVALQHKLEHIVLPLYYGSGGGRGWMTVMKGAISKNASMFHTHRMLRRYATEAYS